LLLLFQNQKQKKSYINGGRSKMKKMILLLLLLLLSVSLFSGCNTVEGKAEKKIEYILASLPNDGGEMSPFTKIIIEEMNRALEPFNATVKYVSADDYSVVSESILSGTAHIGTPSGATYTKAHLENPNVIPMFIQAQDGDKNKGGYPAYIATHIDNKADFEGLSEQDAVKTLKGKTFSFVSATSTSGRLVPTTTLWNVFGPEGTGDVTARNQIFELTMEKGGLFKEVQFGGNHPGSVGLILNKKVYAGAFCCEYAKDNMDKLHIIAQTLVPNGPYWVNKEFMPEEHINAIVAHFVSLTPENAVEGVFSDTAEATDDGIMGKNDRFVAVDPSYYNFLEAMYAGE
jgi:phosphonate transport system substrate-binding protein